MSDDEGERPLACHAFYLESSYRRRLLVHGRPLFSLQHRSSRTTTLSTQVFSRLHENAFADDSPPFAQRDVTL
jgi:hypothetical protein